MDNVQVGILAPLPPSARYLLFSLKPGSTANKSDGIATALRNLQDIAAGDHIVVGVGRSLVLALKKNIEGLGTFPVYSEDAVDISSTPYALMCWLRGNDPGELVHYTYKLQKALSHAFHLEKTVNAFQYGPGLDLTGYEYGTGNPVDQHAQDVVMVDHYGPGMDGSSFLALQQWVHDIDGFHNMDAEQQDSVIGRKRADNEPLIDAPASAHVCRASQKNFSPDAYLLRRSMPWASETNEGLMFAAFAKSFDPSEAQLRRMVGQEDGITDAIFQFSRPVSGSYFWCPPTTELGSLDLSCLI